MKKCPFCKAEIEQNARFCLYCMKPLNEKTVAAPLQAKKPWWPLAVSAVLLAALLLLIFLPPEGAANLPTDPSGESGPSLSQTADPAPTETNPQADDNTPPTTEMQNITQPEVTEPKPTQTQNVPETTPPTTQGEPVPGVPEDIPQEPTVPTESTGPATEPPTEPSAEPTTEPTTKPEDPKSQVVYTYRAARAGDDFHAQYQNSGNDIVITGISQPSDNGVYDIPSYIDGKKVIAIVANAFTGSNAKTVYVPATVKNIWTHAFSGCALTDIYFRGNAIYTAGAAFSGPVTIHCSASCTDRNFRYYKNSAVNYGAAWAEWNG